MRFIKNGNNDSLTTYLAPGRAGTRTLAAVWHIPTWDSDPDADLLREHVVHNDTFSYMCRTQLPEFLNTRHQHLISFWRLTHHGMVLYHQAKLAALKSEPHANIPG